MLESEDTFDIYDNEHNDMQLYNSKLDGIINMLDEFVEEYGYDESGHIQNAINELKECQNESMVEFME